jgi:hypothetical protein
MTAQPNGAKAAFSQQLFLFIEIDLGGTVKAGPVVVIINNVTRRKVRQVIILDNHAFEGV